MRFLLACLLMCTLSFACWGQPPAAQDKPTIEGEDIVDIAPMVVTGVQPGPGLWKVSKDDHVLWIMGTLTPLPKGISWLPRDVEAVLQQADEVIDPPRVSFDAGVGAFRGMLMIPSLLKARKIPDGKTLNQILPPALYARWAVLKRKYLGRNEGVERWRPAFAAQEIYLAAIKQSGLTQHGVVRPFVDRLVKQRNSTRRKIRRTPAVVKFVIEKPKEAIREFSASPAGADADCFQKTLERIESDLPAMAARANAWSIGDLDALRRLPYEDQNRTCMNAFLATDVAQKRGMDALPGRVDALWLAKVDAALAANQVTFATLPISKLLDSDGLPARLRARGYLVEEP